MPEKTVETPIGTVLYEATSTWEPTRKLWEMTEENLPRPPLKRNHNYMFGQKLEDGSVDFPITGRVQA